jgi:hypothetical protein
MTDSTQAGQPSEEELRAYLEQLRAADPAELLVQAYRLLGTGAEVKLGRQDARVLIDAMNAVVEAVQSRVPPELAGQMRDGVRQLQMAQVQAEREADSGAPGEEQPGQAPGEAQPEGAGRSSERPGGAQPAAGPEGQRMTDRLWIPGRDPRPGP